MNVIVRKRPLNDVFKRFQRLPELRMVKIGDNTTTQSFGEERLLIDDANQSRGTDLERFAKVFAG